MSGVPALGLPKIGSLVGHLAEIVDLPREDQRMVELLLGMDFELSGYIHVPRAGEHPGVDDVPDDGRVLAGEVLIQHFSDDCEKCSFYFLILTGFGSL